METTKKSLNIPISKILFILGLSAFMILIAYISLGGPARDYNIYDALKGNDGVATESIIKAIQEKGIVGAYFNDRLGAPDTASYIDACGIDMFLILSIWVINLLLHPSTACIYYLLLILTFIVDALGMSMLLHKLKITPWVNFIFSSLFSMAPFHYYRFMIHISVGNAYSVPIYILLCLYYLDIVSFENNKKNKILLCILGILVGISNPYFVFFCLMLIAISIIIKLLKNKSIKLLIDKIWIFIPIVATLVATRIPSMIFNMINGRNEGGFGRVYGEQDLFGLKIIQLLIPVSYSKIDFLRSINQSYYKNSFVLFTENYMSSLGLIGSVGFILLCGLLIYSFFVKNKERSVLNWEFIDFSSFSVLCYILVGTVGGFGALFNMLVTPQFRTYNRVSICISCFSLLTLAYLLNLLWSKKKNIIVILLGLLMVIGFCDQVYIYTPEDMADSVYRQAIYSDFFKATESMLPEGAMVYQLPQFDYPEEGDIHNLEISKHFVGYLFTDTLKWSYGGIKGRDDTSKYLCIDDGMSLDFIGAIKDMGFSAVYIDCDGYEDGGQAVVDFYRSFNIPGIVSADGKLYLFDISGIDVGAVETLNPELEGYISDYIESFGVVLPDYIIHSVAYDIMNHDSEASKYLYGYIEYKDISMTENEKEYIIYVYEKLLGRTPAQEEINHLLIAFKQKCSRLDVFDAVLFSSELCEKYNF